MAGPTFALRYEELWGRFTLWIQSRTSRLLSLICHQLSVEHRCRPSIRLCDLLLLFAPFVQYSMTCFGQNRNEVGTRSYLLTAASVCSVWTWRKQQDCCNYRCISFSRKLAQIDRYYWQMNPVGRHAALLSLFFRGSMSSVFNTCTNYTSSMRGAIIAHITCLIDLIVLSVQRLNETSFKSRVNWCVVWDFRLQGQFRCACQGVDTERSLPREHCNNWKQKLWVSLIQDSVSLDHISSRCVVQTASDLAFYLPLVLAEEKVW